MNATINKFTRRSFKKVTYDFIKKKDDIKKNDDRKEVIEDKKTPVVPPLKLDDFRTVMNEQEM